jgi:hypothetical protein
MKLNHIVRTSEICCSSLLFVHISSICSRHQVYRHGSLFERHILVFLSSSLPFSSLISHQFRTPQSFYHEEHSCLKLEHPSPTSVPRNHLTCYLGIHCMHENDLPCSVTRKKPLALKTMKKIMLCSSPSHRETERERGVFGYGKGD